MGIKKKPAAKMNGQDRNLFSTDFKPQASTGLCAGCTALEKFPEFVCDKRCDDAIGLSGPDGRKNRGLFHAPAQPRKHPFTSACISIGMTLASTQ
jgi:hypothetical protein